MERAASGRIVRGRTREPTMSAITAERRPLAARFARHRWTVADVERMLGSGLLDETDRVELIEGELIDGAPIGSRHANHVDAIAQLLIRRLPAG